MTIVLSQAGAVPELLTKKDVAYYLQISIRQLEMLISEGKFPVKVIRLGAHPRFRRTELMEYIASL